MIIKHANFFLQEENEVEMIGILRLDDKVCMKK